MSPRTLVALSSSALLVSLAQAAISIPAQAQMRKLGNAELKREIPGRVVYLNTLVGAVPIRYLPDGSMVAQSKKIAPYMGRSRDTGRWWVNRGRLCQKWRNWLQGKMHCFTIRRRGRFVRWVRNDGETGTARLSRRVVQARQ